MSAPAAQAISGPKNECLDRVPAEGADDKAGPPICGLGDSLEFPCEAWRSRRYRVTPRNEVQRRSARDQRWFRACRWKVRPPAARGTATYGRNFIAATLFCICKEVVGPRKAKSKVFDDAHLTSTLTF